MCSAVGAKPFPCCRVANSPLKGVSAAGVERLPLPFDQAEGLKPWLLLMGCLLPPLRPRSAEGPFKACWAPSLRFLQPLVPPSEAVVPAGGGRLGLGA